MSTTLRSEATGNHIDKKSFHAPRLTANMMFMALVFIVLSISVPYMYYAVKIYNYIHEHK